MKLINRKGFFYNVYDMGNGRVLKIEKPRIIQYIKHYFWAGRLPKEVRTLAEISYKIIRSNIDPTLIANPKKENGNSYSQDKVEILENYISLHTIEENKKIIDIYTDHILETWQNGFSDLIFNFTINCGLDKKGKIVLVDFNEVTFDKEEVNKLINKKRWLDSWSRTHWLSFTDKELWAYYSVAMESKITIENLERFWKKKFVV